MNNRLYLHLTANKEKGFALPLAMLIGLILMGTGITVMMRVQGDQSKVIAQKAQADSLTSSEAAVARVRDLLNSVRVMATVDSNCTTGDCWERAEIPTGNPSTNFQRDLKKLAIATACGNTNRNNEIAYKILAPTEQRAVNPGLRDLASGEWFDLGNNRYYRVVNYVYLDDTEKTPPSRGLGWGVLTLEGLSLKSAATDLTNININRDSGDNAASRNRVVVTIQFRGREQSRPEMGYRLLQKLAEELAELSIVEFAPKQEGRNMTMVLGPAKKPGSAKKAAPKAEAPQK